MKPKNRHCMSKRMYILAAMLLFVFAAGAQPYSKVLKRNFWNDGENAVGIRQDSLSRSYAEIYGGYVTGGLRASFEATDAWNAGVRAATIMHLKKFSMTGSFGFEQMWGQGMAGSMFIRQGFYPINVYEFTPGPKTLQTYTFSGGISVDIAPNWRIGGRMDFESDNYAKRKDLRHTTYRLDMTVAPGVQYHDGKFAAGLNYIYSRNGETVKAEQVGSTVAAYTAFFDKGIYYGTEEIWTGSSTHLDEVGVSGLPVHENIHGAAFQASYGDAYADIRWRHRSGEAGEKQTVWYRFPGWDLRSRMGLRLPGPRGAHVFHLAVDYLDQDNYETVLDKVTEGGVTTTVEYGSNLIFNRKNFNASLDYRFAAARWEFGGAFFLSDQHAQSSVMYPYVGLQHLIMPGLQGSVVRRLGPVTASLSARWDQGAIKDNLKTVDSGSGVQGAPERLDRYFVKFRDQMTSYKLMLMPSLTYSFARGFYVDASVRWQHGFNLVYLGNNRLSAMLRAGYNF